MPGPATPPSLEDVARLAQMVALEIDPAHLSGVAGNLGTLLAQASLYADEPVDPLLEPAPVYHP
jgi:hypothetical protein